MVALRSLLLAFLPLLAPVLAVSSTGSKLLVVLEPKVNKGDYSKFWASLEKRGYDITFGSPKDDSLQLVKYGEQQYDHMIMVAPSIKSFSTALSPKSVLDAQFAGLNTLYLLSPNISEINRDTFREYDLEFVERESMLIDAFSHHAEGSDVVTLQPASSIVPHPSIISPEVISGGPILYPRGTVHTHGQNPLLVDVLHAPRTSYVGENRVVDPDEAEVEAAVGKKKEGLVGGRKAGLVSAMQTRDNVRVGWVGSAEMFSDKYWAVKTTLPDGVSTTSGNGAFADDFTKWLFQETGVIKVLNTAHHREGEMAPRDMYRIKDNLEYHITLAQHVTTPEGSSSWAPVTLDDLQLDFTMLDPHIRTALTADTSASHPSARTYSAKFKAPDRHGVFKFVVEYWRPGWSYIRESSTASVVPFRHDEYPRFIFGAYPFYSSALSMSAAFLLFCGIWVTLGEGSAKGKKKTE